MRQKLKSVIKGGKEQTIANQYWNALNELVRYRDKIEDKYEQAEKEGNTTEKRRIEGEFGELMKNFLHKDDSLLQRYGDSYASAYIVAEFMDDVYEGDVIVHKYSFLGERARMTYWGQSIAKPIKEIDRIKPGEKSPRFYFDRFGWGKGFFVWCTFENKIA